MLNSQHINDKSCPVTLGLQNHSTQSPLVFELHNNLSVCPATSNDSQRFGVQHKPSCPGMTHYPSLVVVFCRILTFGSFELFQSSWLCGKAQHERGIGSHIWFKGAPIWPKAPLICEAALLVRLSACPLQPFPLFRPIKILF